MWLEKLTLIILGLDAGVAVSAGTFAFLIVIGVLPRMICKANLKEYVILLENLVIAGVIYGTIHSVFDWKMQMPAAHVLTALFGIASGIFVGGIAAALAEILHTFPIMFRRFHIKRGLSWVMTAMALGKLAGSLFYFLTGYAIIAE